MKHTSANAKAKWTPGPWTAHDDDGTGTLPCVLSDKVNAGGNFYVAQCNVFEDARLISKAPAMLEVLRRFVAMCSCDAPLTCHVDGDGPDDCPHCQARAILRAIEEG